jgi:hypothetical protein
MRGEVMLPDDVGHPDVSRQRESAGAVHFSDFSIVGRVSGHGRSRLQRLINGLELVARRLHMPQASLPERLWIKPRDRRYEFLALQRSPGADVEFGLALMTLAGYEIQFAGGPFGGGLHWIYSGYRLNDMGAHFWGGGFVPNASIVALLQSAYEHRVSLDADLRRAIEINHFATFAPNEEVRTLLCVSALERLAGRPPQLLPRVLPRKPDRKKFLSAIDTSMQDFDLASDALTRLHNSIEFTQLNNSETQVRTFCRSLGVVLRDERWDEAFKVRNTVGHGGTPEPSRIRGIHGDRRIWDALQEVIVRLLERPLEP